MAVDFLIVGGGIGGAVLAHLLTRKGKRVVVLEKNLAPPRLVRPEVLWPPTVALLRSLLAEDDIQAAMLPLAGVRLVKNDQTLLAITTEILDEAGVRPMSTDPNQTRQRLLRPKGFALEQGVEVVAVLKEGARVVGARCREVASGAEREVLARWTVGDDGAHSRVRAACGIPLELRPFPLELMCFGVDWPAHLPQGVARFWVDPEMGRVGALGLGLIPLPGGKAAGLMPVRPWCFEPPRLEALARDWKALAARYPEAASVIEHVAFPEDMVRVHRDWGHAPRYGTEGAVLIGDAAHPVSPAGGQGANMSVADAVALAEIADQEPEQLRAAFDLRRRAANTHSVAITRRAAQVLGLPGWLLAALLPLGLAWVGRRPKRIARFVRYASTAFVGPSPAQEIAMAV